MLTSLEVLDLLKSLTLGLLSLLELGNLNLLSELLEVAQLAGLGGRLLGCCLLDELGAHFLHVAVILDHFGEIVGWARERHSLSLEQGTPPPRCLQTLRIKC